MFNAWKALLASRKANVAFVAMVCVVATVVLRALDKIPPEALAPTVYALMTMAGAFMASQAHEDAARARATTAPSSPTQTVNLATLAPPPIPLDEELTPLPFTPIPTKKE